MISSRHLPHALVYLLTPFIVTRIFLRSNATNERAPLLFRPSYKVLPAFHKSQFWGVFVRGAPFLFEREAKRKPAMLDRPLDFDERPIAGVREKSPRLPGLLQGLAIRVAKRPVRFAGRWRPNPKALFWVPLFLWFLRDAKTTPTMLGGGFKRKPTRNPSILGGSPTERHTPWRKPYLQVIGLLVSGGAGSDPDTCKVGLGVENQGDCPGM